MRLALAASLGVLALTLLSPPSHAVTLDLDPTRASFDVLARRADVAAHVRVLYQQYRLVDGRIVTDSTCQVLNAAYGTGIGDTLTITSLGGYYGTIGQKVFGLERLAPGDELAVLLDRPGYMNGNGRAIIGMTLGVFRVLDAPSLPDAERPIVGYASYVFPGRDETPATVGGFLAAAKTAGGR